MSKSGQPLLFICALLLLGTNLLFPATAANQKERKKSLGSEKKSSSSEKNRSEDPASAFEFTTDNSIKVAPGEFPMSGTSIPSMNDFDDEFCHLLKKWEIPGASIAIVNKGKLVFSRAYGYADKGNKVKTQPDSLFRICSVSKVISSAAILKLVQDGKLTLETKVFPILNLPIPADRSKKPDPRIFSITVRQLLEGTGGWDRRSLGDPMFNPLVVAAATEYSTSLKPTTMSIIKYEFARKLDFSPGTRFCYSNFEYAVLGELIHRITGQKYSDYVREKLMAPMGITRFYPGKTREPAEGEVAYYACQGEILGPSVFPNLRGPLPLEYGGDFCLEAMTADCGWVGSTIDTAKFVSNVFGDSGPKLQPFSPALVQQMVLRPNIPFWQNKEAYFALGWEIENANTKDKLVEKKEGCLPGSEALVTHHSQDGTTIVVAYNSRPYAYPEFQDHSFALVEKTWAAHKYLNNK